MTKAVRERMFLLQLIRQFGADRTIRRLIGRLQRTPSQSRWQLDLLPRVHSCFFLPFLTEMFQRQHGLSPDEWSSPFRSLRHFRSRSVLRISAPSNLPPQPESPVNTKYFSGSKKSTTRRNAWGNMSYADLITQAIMNSPEKRLTLSQGKPTISFWLNRY